MVADSLPSAANAKSDNECKIFVGGLAWEFKNEDLTEYFSTFGTVKDVTIKTDFATGNPRGFGFVVFDAKDAVERVVAQKAHAIKGKKIDPKKITEKEKIRKIFVGGVSLDIPEEEVKTHFEQFGAIEEIVFPTNKETKQRKGFCFITFVDPECCDAACSKQNQKQQVGSKMVDVKKAVPQDQMQQAGGGGYGAGGGYGYGYPPAGGRGGRGGARGGGAAAGGAMGGYGAAGYGYGYDQGYGYDASGYDPYGYAGYSTAYPGYGGADPYAYGGGYGAGASASTSAAAAAGAGGKMRGGRGAGGRGAGGRGRGRGGPY